jgi:hypothetical protein
MRQRPLTEKRHTIEIIVLAFSGIFVRSLVLYCVIQDAKLTMPIKSFAVNISVANEHSILGTRVF